MASDTKKDLSQKLSSLKNIFQTQEATSNDDASVQSATVAPPPAATKDTNESYHEWGVRWGGNAGAGLNALAPALQSCYTHNVNEQNNNHALQAQNQQNIQAQIKAEEGRRDGEKIKLETKRRERERLTEAIKDYQNKIDNIKSNDGVNIMARVNFSIGTLITILLAIYLFVFYSSASFSAFFSSNDISDASDAIFNPNCFSEAMANGAGQFLLILLMPAIFLGLGFLIHQFGESNDGWAKYIKIGALYIVTFIFDALLAFEISQKVHDYTVLSEEQYTVSMAFNSPNFWIVIFSGFVAYVIWGMVFDFTLQHFDNMNAHTKEIKVLEDKIKNTKLQLDSIDTTISQIQLAINNLDTSIAALNTKLQTRSLLDKNVLKKALSDFFSGWLAYMHLAAKSQDEIDKASQMYNAFIAQI